jgi:hypothetical protein
VAESMTSRSVSPRVLTGSDVASHLSNDEKPVLGHVVVVAGPSCVGKSTVIARLLSGETPQLAQALGMTEPLAYELVHATEWRRLETSHAAVLLHYELTRRSFLLARAGRDRALLALDRARDITFLTLWELPDEVERRFNAKARIALTGHARHLRIRSLWRTLRRFRTRRPYFAKPDRLWQLYTRWFAFTTAFAQSPHWVLRSSTHVPSVLIHAVPDVPFWSHVGPSKPVGRTDL